MFELTKDRSLRRNEAGIPETRVPQQVGLVSVQVLSRATPSLED